MRSLHFNTSLTFMKKIYSFLNSGLQHETNSYLPFNNVIEGPINFLHGTYGVFISGQAKIGKNCTIYHQVTIGSNMLLDSKGLGSPVIGDNCLIGAGAKIIGNIRIGANAVVTSDLEDNSVFVLSKPTIFKKEKYINKIYQNSVNGWGYRENGSFIIENDKNIITKLNSI